MPLVIAHRGARAAAPENTIEAFELARILGADGVELDVRRSADGELVIHHDAIAGDLGTLVEMDFAVIRDRAPAVPTLAEALDALTGLLVNIEIKNIPPDPDYDPTHRAVGAVLELLAERDGRDRVLVSSFNVATIDQVHALDPSVDTGFLTFAMEPAAAIGIALEHGHGAWHPDRSTLVGDAVDVVAAAHGAGLAVNVWTVNEASEIEAFTRAGVDGLITDVPDVAIRASSAAPA